MGEGDNSKRSRLRFDALVLFMLALIGTLGADSPGRVPPAWASDYGVSLCNVKGISNGDFVRIVGSRSSFESVSVLINDEIGEPSEDVVRIPRGCLKRLSHLKSVSFDSDRYFELLSDRLDREERSLVDESAPFLIRILKGGGAIYSTRCSNKWYYSSFRHKDLILLIPNNHIPAGRIFVGRSSRGASDIESFVRMRELHAVLVDDGSGCI